MKRVSVNSIRAIAHKKKKGYLAACRAAGKLSDDGRWLFFTEENYALIGHLHATEEAPAGTRPRGRRLSLANAVDRTAPKNCIPCRKIHPS